MRKLLNNRVPGPSYRVDMITDPFDELEEIAEALLLEEEDTLDHYLDILAEEFVENPS